MAQVRAHGLWFWPASHGHSGGQSRHGTRETAVSEESTCPPGRLSLVSPSALAERAEERSAWGVAAVTLLAGRVHPERTLLASTFNPRRNLEGRVHAVTWHRTVCLRDSSSRRGQPLCVHTQCTMPHSLQILALKTLPFAELPWGRKLADLLLEAFFLIVQNYPPFLPLFSFPSLLSPICLPFLVP